jgi:hypothetical protein
MGSDGCSGSTQSAGTHLALTTSLPRCCCCCCCRAESRGSDSSFLAGFVMGGVVFGALGFLLAPQVGGCGACMCGVVRVADELWSSGRWRQQQRWQQGKGARGHGCWLAMCVYGLPRIGASPCNWCLASVAVMLQQASMNSCRWHWGTPAVAFRCASVLPTCRVVANCGLCGLADQQGPAE